ncbi:Cell wall alpha-1,3-glucan synthase mok13 [Cytospora mali]|uniref:alpha-1,3-glucan synthase n=1 Tax=Cytospora mali TaxID=578113 RepID=A0A194UMM4_CYTMA|nr:Cell wall alpha-1,3-glucan synthase mok13 [Valsa mali var. pyri (nom. inval.)]
MFALVWLSAIALFSSNTFVHGLKYTLSEVDYNLNANKTATNPADYWIEERTNFTYTKSPDNWRFPFYTVFLDRFVNGDPTNDNANKTLFETDMMSTQIRNGGDLQGLVDSLDYIAGMGIKGIYIAGSPFINQPWGADAYSPLDLTLLDRHSGDLKMWQNTMDEIHARGMWVILDNTMATLGDLIGFEGYLNTSAPFTVKEHKVKWKTSRQYLDFDFGNTYNESCDYPTFWYEDGNLVASNVTAQLKGCYDSDFDQYGDVEAFGVFPDWERQLSKFASVQDRLREWYPPVLERLQRFSCMTIAALDIDGFRVDKAMQVTVDAQASFTTKVRSCAEQYNKTNFMIVGEITAGNTLGSIWLGRGRSADLWIDDINTAQTLTWNDSSSDEHFLREAGKSALDAGAFHYSVYRFLTRFLGMSGNLEAGYDLPTDWVTMWNEMVQSNDFYNAVTGEFDPRHLYGVANQDVFRWPGVEMGTQRMMLGYMITTLLMPGIPLVYYGEEQDLYIVDSTASNYVFGRQAFAPSQAWLRHGCYSLGSDIYVNWPADRAKTGCNDPRQAWDHRDPSAPIRNTMKHMFALRETYPVLEGGWLLAKLANQTSYTLQNGSSVATEFGIWSVARAYNTQTQNVSTSANSSQPVWLVYHNQGSEKTYSFSCDDADTAFVSPFDAGTTVKNLMNSSDIHELEESAISNTNWTGTKATAGCLSSIVMKPYEFKVFVASENYVSPAPMITSFSPGHDFPIDSSVNTTDTVEIVLGFNVEMDCDSVSDSISVTSYIDGSGDDYNGQNLTSFGTAKCGTVTTTDTSSITGSIPTAWTWTATLSGLVDGIHKIHVWNATATDGTKTNSKDNFLLRRGLPNNPVVFPEKANYSSTLLHLDDNGIMYVNHSAPGAQMFRYSTNWGSSWSNWANYTGDYKSITAQSWSGTEAQAWEGKHVMVQYWSRPLGSSAFIQHGDSLHERRFPHIFLHGDYNEWGYDAGVRSTMSLEGNGTWEMHFMHEWPASVQVNIWGINPDGQPDQTFIYGDIDDDGVLDRLSPSSLSNNVFNMTVPAWPALSFKLVVDDATWRIHAIPTGTVYLQIFLFFLLGILPICLAGLAGWIYVRGFYQVKVNKRGFKANPKNWLSIGGLLKHDSSSGEKKEKYSIALRAISPSPASTPVPAIKATGEKRTVLIATMEYNIDDWNISIKIGGLGVMAKLMSTALSDVNLIWVVPCVGGIDYPIDEPAESMFVQIMGESYEVHVQYHRVRNITYVILDAPIFRQQTKAEPYIARMDDVESGILYAAWNSCIAETIRRFPVDIYHINDYHGAIAPLYLLPQTIPVCLSLHNAEFQGLWPMRSPEEAKEVCDVFGLSMEIVKKYVQYGTVFNLLHAGASYLRYHQRGFGAVGVSKKYGDRSLARYPIFWSLKTIGQLPNPDPSDTAAWEPEKDAVSSSKEGVEIDQEFENARGGLRVKAQEWAGLEIDPTAELFVFVGRWSLQKGVDLIADIFPSILEKYPKTQLICVGPVIDLYGKFAALKLAKLMEKYPKRVFSKPEFTQLPPYIFSGAEFALIPSRDEPFGLVAVEFGRKGAIGVGARVGGLGQMPGFWYTVESMSPAHLLDQFRHALKGALESKQPKRALMRAWSAKQRFPVKQWVQQLDSLYDESIRISNKEANKKRKLSSRSMLSLHADGPDTPGQSRPTTPNGGLQISISSPNAVRSSFLHNNSPGLPSPGLPSPSPAGLRSPSNLSSPGLPSPGLTPKFPWATLEPGNSRNSTMSVASFDSFAVHAQNDGNLPTSPSFGPGSHDSIAGLPLPQPSFYQQGNRNSSQLSLSDVVGERQDMKLQKVDLSFNDSNGEFLAEFEQMLANITAKNSHTELCIEEFLKKSEKEWFKRYREAKLGLSRDMSRTRSPMGRRPESRDGKNRDSSIVSRGRQRHRSITPHSNLTYESTEVGSPLGPDVDDEFLLGDGYKAPTGLRKILSIRIGDWPVYAFFMALGQILSVNSYQIVLLTGEASQTSDKLYIIGSVYLATSIMYWFMVRNLKSMYAITLPWLFFGLAFLLLGIAPFFNGELLQLAATIMYAAGASSGGVMFALNFGDEGGSPTRQWIIRAIIVAGIAQVYSLMLWYWGSLVSNSEATMTGYVASTAIPVALVVCIPIAVVLWTIGLVLFFGLPAYYRQSPESIPGLYISLLHRKLVPWFFIAVIIQNYWLSAPYGRNWAFLFGSQYIPGWGVFLLALGFFVVLWAIMLYGFSFFSDEHTWLLPIFAIGLGAPRWAQMLWGVSGMGWYVPWAGSALGSAILSRCLWLQHVLAVLVGSQVIGSGVTMLARATCPNAKYSTATFPDFSEGAMPGVSEKWFWICLAFQLVIPFGFFKFFRKEQVAKP